MLLKFPTEFVGTASDWLDSSNLARIAACVARRLRLPAQDVDDLLQELRITVWKAGLQTQLNASWVFRAAECRAVDLHRLKAHSDGPSIGSPSAGGSAQSGHEPDAELSHLLAARVAHLPSELRIFHGLYLEGLSERQIGTRMGVTRRAVRTMAGWSRRYLAGRSGVSRRGGGP